MVNKIILFHNFVNNGGYDLVFVVETWLSPKIKDALVCPPGYDVIRKDRTDKRGGGVLILYKSCYKIFETSDTQDTPIEHLCVDLIIPAPQHRLRFLCVYSPPDLSRQVAFQPQLFECISKCKRNAKYFYLLGDFNMPSINWSTMSATNNIGECFIDSCIEMGLCQHVPEATTTNGSLLDLLLCDEVSFRKILSVNVQPPLSSTCDHDVISFQLLIDDESSSCKNIPDAYLYDKGDYDIINQKLCDINWEEIITTLNFDVQKIYDYFLETIHKLIRQHVPTSKFKKSVRQPNHITRLAKRKKRLYRKLKGNKKYKSEYKKLSKQYDTAVSSWYDYIENRVCQDTNSRSFYKYANKKLRSFPSIPPIVSDSGDLVIDDKEKANLFNKTFYDTYVKDDGKSLNLNKRTAPQNELSQFPIDKDIINEAINNLTAKKSQTPDGVPSFVLKKLSTTLIPFLVIFFNLTLQTSIIPWQWKVAHITPCYKKGNKNCAANYRPISQTSVFCRVFEKIMCSHMLKHLYKHSLLSEVQHGFLPRRSTTSQLLITLNNWQEEFYSKNTTNIIYTDLAKAFDKVSHPKLLEILVSYDFNGLLLQWIRSFLTNKV